MKSAYPLRVGCLRLESISECVSYHEVDGSLQCQLLLQPHACNDKHEYRVDHGRRKVIEGEGTSGNSLFMIST